MFEEAVEVLRRGGIVAVATETLFGLCVDALDPAAVARVQALKGRGPSQPFPVLLADRAMLDRVALPPGPLARRLMDRYWPGALTLVVREKPGLPRGIIAADGGVAVRIPGQSAAFDLVRAFGGPLTGTSANRSGEPPGVTAEEVSRSLGTGVDWVVPGRAPGGPATTVIDVTRTPPRVLRQGTISVDLETA